MRYKLLHLDNITFLQIPWEQDSATDGPITNEDKLIRRLYEENIILKQQANCAYHHMKGVTCTKCGWFYYETDSD